LLVVQSDPAATADALSQLIGDVELAQSFGGKGSTRAEEIFSIEKNVHALREIIASCLLHELRRQKYFGRPGRQRRRQLQQRANFLDGAKINVMRSPAHQLF